MRKPTVPARMVGSGRTSPSSGGDLEAIAGMSHTSTVVTKQYAHLHPDHKRSELAKMERMGRTRGEVSRKVAKGNAGQHS